MPKKRTQQIFEEKRKSSKTEKMTAFNNTMDELKNRRSTAEGIINELEAIS